MKETLLRKRLECVTNIQSIKQYLKKEECKLEVIDELIEELGGDEEELEVLEEDEEEDQIY